MLTENRKYHFIGELNLSRSKVLDETSQPKDDQVNWLFLNAGEQQFSFVYKIKKPSEAKYGVPFEAEISFTMIENVKTAIKIGYTYEVLRGPEVLGTVCLITPLE